MPYRIDIAKLSCLSGRAEIFVNEEAGGLRRCASLGDFVSYRFFIPRLLGMKEGCLSLFPDGENTPCYQIPLSYVESEGEYNVFKAAFSTEGGKRGLYFCRLQIDSIFGKIEAVGGNSFGFAPCEGNPKFVFQLTLSEFVHPVPKWLQGGVIYHVFVDRFFRGGNAPLKKGAILNEDWENGIPQYPEYPGAPLANNMFFGGDLEGITQKLSYIASLGVSAIYLSPIFRAASNHKYDTGDYLEIDEMFGGKEAFSRLLSKAKEYGIRIILDGVFNHTGADSLYFNRYGTYGSLGAYQSKDSPYYSWYTFRHHPDDYECWWNIEILPRLNTECPACFSYFLGEGGVVDTYAKMGIGGMRLDVADELSSSFIEQTKNRLAAEVSDAVLYGEVWEDASNKIAYGKRRSYYQGKELDGVMNYPLRTGLVSYIREKRTEALSYYFNEVLPNMPKRVADLSMNLLGTHDTVRIATALSAPSPEGRTNKELSLLRMTEKERERAVQLVMAAYTVIATLEGVPSIYYGDEVGLEGYSDPFNRMPFPWGRENKTLLKHYQKIGALRKKKAYADGAFRLVRLNKDCLAFTREKKNTVFLTVYNNSPRPLSFLLPDSAKLLIGKTEREEKTKSHILAPEVAIVVSLQQGDTVSF